jgi:putative hydrolase of the HAD superfamily
MSLPYHETIRRHCHPMEPIQTGEQPALRSLGGIRAVLFDLYGTLFLSSTGDPEEAASEEGGAAFRAALEAVGVRSDVDGEEAVRCLHLVIRRQREMRQSEGVLHPEIDVVRVWEQTLSCLIDRGRLPEEARQVDLKRLTVEYEVRFHPAWPVPRLEEHLEDLRGLGLVLGIISNAQFYTSALFPALLARSPEALGFDPLLQYYSYAYGKAKPGLFLFRLAAQALQDRDIAAHQVLYVGNDMLNDILPAIRVGFHTALWAGDARSLRRRIEDPRTAETVPDLVLTDLSQLVRCLSGRERA